MAQLQKVSWRTASYAALGSVVAVASVVAIVHSDGARPTSLTSNAATRWLVYQPSQLLVLADGLSGRVLAKIDAKSDANGEVAVQGTGGAFLVAPSQGSVRAISTAKLQLGTPEPVASLSGSGNNAKFGVGPSGLTVVSSQLGEANVVTADNVARPITVPKSDSSLVAADGSMWLFAGALAKHLNVDESITSMPLRAKIGTELPTTVGPHAVSYDSKARMVRWLDGGDVPVDSIANVADAVLQEPGDDAPCVWLGTGDTLACVGATGIDRTITIPGMDLRPGDRLAIAGNAAVVVRSNRDIIRLDLDSRQLPHDEAPTVPATASKLTITAARDLIWIDDESGKFAWVVHRFGINTIDKNDVAAPLLDAQGQPKSGGSNNGQPNDAGGNQPGDVSDAASHLDGNGHDDPPKAFDDSVTARAGNTVTIPVTANDWDPDGNAIGVVRVGDLKKAEHGATDVLNGTTVAYVPDRDFSGTDSFSYTIVDEHNNEVSATVNVLLFAPDSPNQPPIARPDHVTTRLGHPITIDVLANDIDPERDTLTVATFRQKDGATITNATGPTGLNALLYKPPPTPGDYEFTYQAADPQGGTSQETKVTVHVSGDNAPNEAPTANPDSLRLAVGDTAPLDVRANDVDPDGDELHITAGTAQPTGVKAIVRSEQLLITLQPGAEKYSVVTYTLTDRIPGHEKTGKVLIIKIDDTAPNRPPVANPDTERVVIGSSVKIPVTLNDIDPDHDVIQLVSVDPPADGAGATSVEGNFVRFIPNLPNITEPTPVTFTYQIGDGHAHEVTGRVTVTVLASALPRAPFARDDFADTVTDKPVNIDVLANDSDPSGGRPSLYDDPSCSSGSAQRTSDERVTYYPPRAAGTYRCKYRVINTQGLQAEATIIVTVTEAPPGNRDPILDKSTLTRTVNVGDSIEFNAGTLASDPDGDTLVFAAVGQPNLGGITTSPNGGPFIYAAPPRGVTDKIPNDTSIAITVSDGHGGNVSDRISIRIVDTTANPIIKPTTHDIARQILLGDTASINVPSELSDANPGTTLTVVSATRDTGSPDARVDNVGGIVTVTPTTSGTVSVTYVVANSSQQTAIGKIKVIVNDPPVVNPPPVAVNDVLDVPSGGVGRATILLNDTGIYDSGDKVPAVSILSRPPTSFGTVDLSNGTLTFTAAPYAAGVDYVRYTVSDGTNVSAPGTVTITIQPCSVSPPSVSTARVFTPYQTPINIDLTQYVTSGVIRPGSISGAGLTGPIGQYTPPAGLSGSETVTYTVENGCGQTTQGTLTIDVNRAPVGGNISRNLARGDTLTLVVGDLASDDEPLHITTINGNPAWVTFDGTTISATPPTTTPSGVYTFTAMVADLGGLTATATVHLTISNLAPIAVSDAYSTAISPFSFNPTDNDSDPEGGPVHVQAISWIDGSGPIVRSGDLITVPLGHGVSTLSYTIVDDGGLTATSTVTITYNRPPTVADVSGTTNQPTLAVHLSPTDPDGDTLGVICNSTLNLDVQVFADPELNDPNGFDLHITVLNGFIGTDTFTCWATDPFNATATATVTVTITA